MTGLLYIVTGLLVEIIYVNFTRMGLGTLTPIFNLSSLLIAPLFSIGPVLLFLSGITILGLATRRNRLCLIGGCAMVIGLAAWTVPSIGWRYATWGILVPVAIALLVAWLILLLTKKRWISAVIGSGLSSPFSFFGGVVLLYQNLFGAKPFSTRELALIVPGVFVFISFLAALRSRTDSNPKTV